MRTARVASEPGMARAMHQPLLGDDTTLQVVQNRSGIGIPARNDALLHSPVRSTGRIGVPCATGEACHRFCDHDVAVVGFYYTGAVAMKNDRGHGCAKRMVCDLSARNGNAATLFHRRKSGWNVVGASIRQP